MDDKHVDPAAEREKREAAEQDERGEEQQEARFAHQSNIAKVSSKEGRARALSLRSGGSYVGFMRGSVDTGAGHWRGYAEENIARSVYWRTLGAGRILRGDAQT